jgi:hypothetical protein
MSERLPHRLASPFRAVWRALVGAADYWSNGDRRRPRFSEDADIYDPAQGGSRRDPSTDERAAERGEQPHD